MKVFKFKDNQPLTKNFSKLEKTAEYTKAQKGKWYHWNRVYLIKSSNSEKYGFVYLNFFERLARNICKMHCFSKELKDRKIVVISPKNLSKTIKNIGHNAKVLTHQAASITVEPPEDLYLTKNWTSIPWIPENYTSATPMEEQRKAHERAKIFLSKNLQGLGAHVAFISPPEKAAPELSSIEIGDPLNPAVFSWQATLGVQDDITRDGLLNDKIIRKYSAASQFNGCEAPDNVPVRPGNGVKAYKGDPTQGPQAQLAFPPDQVEIINCGGNIGFNGLCNVLEETTKDTVRGGYLTPVSRNIDSVIDQLRNFGHKIEYLSVSNRPIGGIAPVGLILVAAPAFGMYNADLSLDPNKKREVQFLCALHGFRAQFCDALQSAGDKQVILNVVAVGLGAFGNNKEVVAKAFYTAAKEFEGQLAEKKVQVRFQVFDGVGKALILAKSLHLEELKLNSLIPHQPEPIQPYEDCPALVHDNS
jgi:hypothetical protein